MATIHPNRTREVITDKILLTESTIKPPLTGTLILPEDRLPRNKLRYPIDKDKIGKRHSDRITQENITFTNKKIIFLGLPQNLQFCILIYYKKSRRVSLNLGRN